MKTATYKKLALGGPGPVPRVKLKPGTLLSSMRKTRDESLNMQGPLSTEDFQRFYNQTGRGRLQPLTVDGKFGPNTKEAYGRTGAEFNTTETKNKILLGNSPDKSASKMGGVRPSQPNTITPFKGALPAAPTNKLPKKPFDRAAAGEKVKSMAPYASNLINSFRTPPKPIRPTMDSMVSAQHVNMDNDRNMVSRVARGANANADATLDENTSQAVKQYNRATEINSLSAVNEKERNTNIQIDNDNARLNATISASNNAKWDGYNAAKVERGVAQQREQSANIANAGDKYVGIQNEKAKQEVDLEKQRILATTDIYGTYGRNLSVEERARLKAEADARKTNSAMGGKIKSFNAKRMYPAMK